MKSIFIFKIIYSIYAGGSILGYFLFPRFHSVYTFKYLLLVYFIFKSENYKGKFQ